MATIAEKLEYLDETKTQIKNALISKGATIADDDTFRSYATTITNLKTVPTLQAKTATVTANGTVTYTPDSGYDGLSSVAVTTNITPSISQSTYTSGMSIGTTVTTFSYTSNNTAIKFALIIAYEIGNTGATSSSTITITLQGSQNNSSWSNINSFTKKRDSHNIAPCNKYYSSVTGYKYYRIRVSSTDNEPNVNCVNYKIS